MTDMNPFTIRAQLLVQAQTILSENAHMKFEIAKLEKKADEKWPTYTTEDVILEAEKLNAFVSQTKR